MRRQAIDILRRSRAEITAGQTRRLADGELLALFTSRREEAAFTTIVQRHGQLVMSVCRRLLGHDQDAEDAFQATFLVLARKAGSIRKGESLACWLHGVARRTALRLKTRSPRRRGRDLAGVEPADDGASAESAALREAMRIFDEEIARLPAHYRAPLVLCYLEGKTQDEAARQLGWTIGAFRGRLERARGRMRGRLSRRGVSVPAALVGIGLATATGQASLARATVEAAALLASGQVVNVSAEIVQTVEGVCRAMFATKAKGVVFGFGVAFLIAAGGVMMVPGFLASVPVATASDGPVKPQPVGDVEIDKLVNQLGHPKFAEREAAQALLRAKGKAALPAVRAGTKDANAEIAKRCDALLDLIMVDVLKDENHPVWRRFKKTVGGDDASRSLYLEMIATPHRAEQLDAAETNPDQAGDIYLAELTRLVEAMKRAYKDAEVRAAGNTGWLWPAGGIPSPGEFSALLFLGTYPATAAMTFKQADDHDRVAHHNVFGIPLSGNRTDSPNPPPTPPPVRRLFAAWLATRTDPNPIGFGTNLALFHGIAEAVPSARKNAANAALDPKARGFAVLAVGRFGNRDDLPLLEKAFADGRVFHATRYTNEGNVSRPVEALVSDAAVAASLRISGQHPADFGFPLLAMYKERGPNTLVKYHLLGFFDNASRTAAHRKAKDWLARQKSAKQPLEPEPEPSPELRGALNELDDFRHASDEKFAEMEKRGTDLIARYPRSEDRARIYYQLAHVYAQSDINRHPDRVAKYANLSLKLGRDPVQRATLYSYLSSAAEVDRAGGTFPERRRTAADLILKGYSELLKLNFPEVAPELPAVGKHHTETSDAAEIARQQRLQEAELQARHGVEFVRALVQRRDTFVQQLRYLYGREPNADDELRNLARNVLGDKLQADDLLNRISRMAR